VFNVLAADAVIRVQAQGDIAGLTRRVDPVTDLDTGKYYVKSKPSVPSKAARDSEAAKRLWSISEDLIGRTISS